MSEDNVSELVSGLEISPSQGQRAPPRRSRRKPKYMTYTQEQLEAMPQAKRESIEAKKEVRREKQKQKKIENREAKKLSAGTKSHQSASDSNNTSVDAFFRYYDPNFDLDAVRDSDPRFFSRSALRENEELSDFNFDPRFEAPGQDLSPEEIKSEVFLPDKFSVPLKVIGLNNPKNFMVRVMHLEPWLARIRALNGSMSLEKLLRREAKAFFVWPPYVLNGYKPTFEEDEEVNNKFVAIDCEMVETTKSKNFPARVSIVNYYGDVLLDRYVEPDAPVTQWRTRFSGISPQVLDKARKEGTIVTIEKIQKLLNFVTLLGMVTIGHNVSCDLKSLQYSLPKDKVLDTQRLKRFKTDCGGDGLRRLIDHYFNIKIQKSKNGHDSVEDARASMLLFRTFQREFHKDHKMEFIEPI